MQFFSREKLTLEEASAIAQKVCGERQWHYSEPVSISPGLLSWTIVTNARGMGANARIKISRRSKEVVSAVYCAR